MKKTTTQIITNAVSRFIRFDISYELIGFTKRFSVEINNTVFSEFNIKTDLWALIHI